MVSGYYTPGGYSTCMATCEMRKEGLLGRWRRIKLQVRSRAQMVGRDHYYVGVLTQVSAPTKGLQPLGLGLLDDHLRHGVADAVADGGAQRMLAEATAADERLLKR